jgi:hypothetical protein
MKLDCYFTGAIGMKQQTAGGLYGFSRGHKWARWKSKETNSMTSDASQQTPGQIGCNCQFIITRYLTLTNIGQSPFNLQICLCSVKQFLHIRYQFSCYCLSVYLFLKSFDSVLFCMIRFCSIIQCSIIHFYSVIFCSDTGIVKWITLCQAGT